MTWKDFENKCIKVLSENYGNYFRLIGRSDSTTSDVLYENNNKSFYIEVKKNPAQSGQFVVFENKLTRTFEFSKKNKSKENEYTKKIIKYMDENYDKFSNIDTAGKEILLDKDIFYNWIINYYQSEKNVEYFITNIKNGELFFFTPKEFKTYFDVKAVYRVKKSGSSNLNKKHLDEFKDILDADSIDYSIKDFEVETEFDLKDKVYEGKEKTYLLRKNNRKNRYNVRMLSNTYNANVIFSIKLKDKKSITDDLISKNQKEFENYIK